MQEHELEEFLENHPEIIEEGIRIIERQKRVHVGFIDLFCQDKDNNYVIIELKQEPDHAAVAQIAKYALSLEKEGISREKIRGMLVTREIDEDVRQLCEFFNIELRGLTLGKPQRRTAKQVANYPLHQEVINNHQPNPNLLNNILTKTERNVVSLIAEATKITGGIAYSDLSTKLRLSSSCLRSYISSIVSKHTPIIKTRTRFGKVMLSIN